MDNQTNNKKTCFHASPIIKENILYSYIHLVVFEN
jgi:hypothetical protein